MNEAQVQRLLEAMPDAEMQAMAKEVRGDFLRRVIVAGEMLVAEANAQGDALQAERWLRRDMQRVSAEAARELETGDERPVFTQHLPRLVAGVGTLVTLGALKRKIRLDHD